MPDDRDTIALLSKFIAAVFSSFCLFVTFGLIEKPDLLAAIGQMIGGWATSLAFFFLFVSIHLQRQQTKLQQDALARQMDEILHQRTTSERQNLLSSFSTSFEFLLLCKRVLANRANIILRTIPHSPRLTGDGVDVSPVDINEESAPKLLATAVGSAEFIQRIRENPVYFSLTEEYVRAYDDLMDMTNSLIDKHEIFSVFFSSSAEREVYLRFKEIDRIAVDSFPS